MRAIRVIIVFLAAMMAAPAFAETCTSIASGNWNAASTWSCTGATTRPGAGDSVIIVSPHTVTLDGNFSATNLQIDAGATLSDGNNMDLTLSGNAVINGTYDATGNGGNLIMTGNGTTLEGTGTIIDINRVEIDANVTIPAGSTLNLTLRSEIRVGKNAGATLTIDGTLNGTALNNGARLIRLDNNNTANVIINGVIDAPGAFIELQSNGTIQNNGSVTIAYLDGKGGTNITWTQGANSTLSLSQPTQGWNNGTFNASATGNTVNFNGTATPFDPATYYNIGGTAVICPLAPGITVLGTSPCSGVTYGSVTGSPGLCVNDTVIGTQAWTGLGNLGTKNAVYAQASGVKGQTTNYLKCTNYGFNVPAGATITGITVGVWDYSTKKTKDKSVVTVKAGVPQTAGMGFSDLATLTRFGASTSLVTYGGAGNLWGNTWTIADINSPGFGVAFAAVYGATDTAFIDHMYIVVNYTLPAEPHHFEISYTGQAATCRPVDLIIRACADAVCTPYTAGATGSVSATGSVNFPNGASFTLPSGQSQTTVSAWITQPSTSTFGVTGGLNPATCNINGSCDLVAADSAFLISAPDHVAGSTQAIYLQAVRKATGAAVCVPAFTGPKQFGVSCAYTLPATGTVAPVVDFAAIRCDGTTYSFTKTFDATGKTSLPFSYEDVGRLSLTATHFGSGASAGLAISGTATFVSAPASLSLSTPAGKKVAQASFVSSVSALTSTGAVAPNFGQEGEQIRLDLLLDAPAGGNAPALATGFASYTAGVASIPTSWSEVGQARLQASLLSGSYLGSGLAPIAAEKAETFIPSHFETIVTDGCAGCGYTYSGQTFKATVIAKNAGDFRVFNYVGAQACNASVGLYSSDGTTAIVSGALMNAAIASGDWLDGRLVNWPLTFTFFASPHAPETIRVRVTESGCDGVTSSALEGATEERAGRIRVGNAYGSDLLPLNLAVSLQYFNGATWATASSDSSTALAGLVYSNWDGLVPGSVTGAVSAPLIAGKTSIHLSKTGAPGSVNAGLSQPAYLQSISGKATFGVYRGNNTFIHARENY